MLSEKVKLLREQAGWSKRELGRRMGKDFATHIIQIESGHRQNLSLRTACELASAFGITLDELVEGTEFALTKKDK